MPRDGRVTREKILAAAHREVMKRGFAATSVDSIQAEAGVGRGTIFYHFPTKDDMARELIRRHAERDREMTLEFLAQAEARSRDPLDQVLVFTGLYIELFETLEQDRPPGCLFGSYSYEAGLFDDETNAVITEAVLWWREVVGAKFEEALALHPPLVPVDGATLADLLYDIFEGSLLMSRVLGERAIMAEHLRQFRNYLELAFDVVGGAAAHGEPAVRAAE